MNYLAKFDRVTRDCCEVLTPKQQVRSGFKTKHQLRSGATLLQREMKRKVPLEKIEEALMRNPIRSEVMVKDFDMSGIQFDPVSEGPIISIPRQSRTIGVGPDPNVLFPDAPGSSVPSGFSFLDEFGSQPGDYPRSYAFESDTESVMSDLSNMFPSDISEGSGLGVGELNDLYQSGTINLNQYARGVELIQLGQAPREIVELEVSNRGQSSRGGARERAGRPTRSERDIAIITGQTAGEQRREAGEAIDEMLEEAVDEIEQEEEEQE